MKEFNFIAILFACLTLTKFSTAQDNVPAYQTSLNYSVPESPAFSILDLNPSKVMRGTNAKALSVSIANQIATGEKIGSGLALDVCPLQAFGTVNKAFLEDSVPGYLYRLLNYTQVSFATTDVEGSDDLLYGLGARITLYDSKDILREAHYGYRKRISNALTPSTHATGEGSDEFVRGRNKSLGDETAKIKDEFRNMQGFSITTGYAHSGKITQGTVAFEDSNLTVTDHQAWLSMQFQSKNGVGLNFIYIGRYGAHGKPTNNIGLALRSDNTIANYSIEFINDFTNSTSTVGGIIEIKALSSIDILFNVSGSNEHNANPDDKKLYLNVKPTVRYVLAGG